MKDIHAFEPIWENWVIDEEIGHGSYGTVWKAHREDQFSHVKQYAAVKHISIPKQDGQGENDIPFPSEEAKSQYYRNMLNQLIVEIDAMISLRGKPNIVSYEEHKVVPKEYNSGYDLFLRMELLTSISAYCPFTEYIKHPLSRNEVIQLGIDIATALETLENRKLVHRDIKPDNIFIDEEGHFKLGDFGTARVLEVTGNASTKTGTPNYMAPEVYTKLVRYDQTVDIYSLGIMLYRYMNDGYLPFMSATALEADVALARRIHGEPIEPPCNADEELSRIILKACAYKAEDRYQNAQELKRDLIRCKERKMKEVEIPIVCLTDDGQEIYRGHKKAQSGSKVRITIEDIPYKKFVGEDKELISAREIIVSIDENGKMNPGEAVFTLRDCKTLFAVSVQVICRDENNNEILVQKTECFYQNRNLVKAPTIVGYESVGQTEVEVEVLNNRTSRPPQVVFQYVKGGVASQAPKSKEPVECDIPVLCMLENGEEILNSKRTCREDASNIVTAPEITGYVLIGDDSKKIRVSHNGNAEPDKVIFTYRKMESEEKDTTISVICRDDYGNELKRDTVVAKSGQTLNFAAPEIKGFKLINDDKRTVELIVDDKCVPSQNEVLFVYEKESGKNNRRFIIIGVIAALLLISAGIAIWRLNRPVQKYTITWKNEDGAILELDNDVTFDSMPEFNGSVPIKPEDNQYIYTFTGWTPSIKPIKADEEYVAVYEKTEKEKENAAELGETETASVIITEMPTEALKAEITPENKADNSAETSETETIQVNITDNPAETPMPEFTMTWVIGAETTTTKVAFGDKPTLPDPVKDPDDQYTYSFSGWYPAVEDATGDETYRAIFKPETRSYTITWQDDTGKTIDTITEAYGTKPSHSDPAKDADQQYTYTFSGWQPAVENVTGDTTYKATFKSETRSYTITWQDDTGKTIDTITEAYGTKPSHSDPAKDADQQYTYTFSGWQPAVENVTGDTTYKAIFKSETRSYTITWQDDTGKTIDTTTEAYGTKPSHSDPVKDADQQYTYTFSGWQPEIKKVTGDSTYKAVFHAEKDWICSNCQAANTFEDYFCTNCAQTKLCLECGHCVPKDDQYCSNCATEVGKWKCWQCGEPNDKNDLFCVNCGTGRHKPGVQ